MAYGNRRLGFLPKWRHDASGHGCWPNDSFTTGSESLHDITMGLFLVAVISRLAGSRWTDDSWQSRPFRGGRPRKTPGEGTAFYMFRLFREESGGSQTSQGTGLPLVYMDITFSSPFPMATPSHAALTSIGVRYVQCTTPSLSEL